MVRLSPRLRNLKSIHPFRRNPDYKLHANAQIRDPK